MNGLVRPGRNVNEKVTLCANWQNVNELPNVDVPREKVNSWQNVNESAPPGRNRQIVKEKVTLYGKGRNVNGLVAPGRNVNEFHLFTNRRRNVKSLKS